MICWLWQHDVSVHIYFLKSHSFERWIFDDEWFICAFYISQIRTKIHSRKSWTNQRAVEKKYKVNFPFDWSKRQYLKRTQFFRLYIIFKLVPFSLEFSKIKKTAPTLMFHFALNQVNFENDSGTTNTRCNTNHPKWYKLMGFILFLSVSFNQSSCGWVLVTTKGFYSKGLNIRELPLNQWRI